MHLRIYLIFFHLILANAEVFERVVKYPLPFYNEIAPCPCDLTENKCDTQCCCDQDCPEDYHGNWTCIAGLEGGFDPGQIIDSNCTHEPALFDSDWNSFLCISKTRTSYLGLYYDELLRVDSKLTPASTSPQGSYSKSNDYPTAFYRKIYKDGYPIKVVYNAYQGIYGTLNMPTSIQAGCVWSPVAFLKDSKSKCHKTLKPQLCSRNTLLDYQMYLMPLPTGVDATNIPKVLSNPANNTAQVPINFNYFFALEPDAYVASQLLPGTRKIQSQDDEVDDYDEILQGMQGKRGEELGFFHGISRDKCVKMERFSSDQSVLKQEDQVHLHGSKCINAVLEVNYEIFWIGNEITRMNANILLGNLSLIESKAKIPKSASQYQELKQIFSVKFYHDLKVTKEKSGNPGYDIGKPIKGLNTDPKTWGTHPSSLCRNTPLKPISFLQNSISGCLLQLSRDNFTQCSELSEALRDLHFEAISTFNISKGGDEEDYVPIIFEDLTQYLVNNATQECIVPAELHIEVMYTNSNGINRINGVKVNYLPEKWTWYCYAHKCNTKQYQVLHKVQFIEIPLVWHHQNTSKFWILQQLELCKGDQCWSGLWYAFSSHQKGDEIAYASLCGLLMIPISIGTLWFTREFW